MPSLPNCRASFFDDVNIRQTRWYTDIDKTIWRFIVWNEILKLRPTFRLSRLRLYAQKWWVMAENHRIPNFAVGTLKKNSKKSSLYPQLFLDYPPFNCTPIVPTNRPCFHASEQAKCITDRFCFSPRISHSSFVLNSLCQSLFKRSRSVAEIFSCCVEGCQNFLHVAWWATAIHVNLQWTVYLWVDDCWFNYSVPRAYD